MTARQARHPDLAIFPAPSRCCRYLLAEDLRDVRDLAGVAVNGFWRDLEIDAGSHISSRSHWAASSSPAPASRWAMRRDRAPGA